MLDNTQTSPLAGLRLLTAAERQQRSAAMACVDPAKKPGVPDCSQSLWISLFFDGTGNNQYEDTTRSKHSNVARLFRTHRREGALLLANRVREALLSAQEGSEKA
jgi:hypothetical protein